MIASPMKTASQQKYRFSFFSFNTQIWNVLLQVLDDGRLTDGRGRTVDFTNTIIIMTSNIGSRFLSSSSSKISKETEVRFSFLEGVFVG